MQGHGQKLLQKYQTDQKNNLYLLKQVVYDIQNVSSNLIPNENDFLLNLKSSKETYIPGIMGSITKFADKWISTQFDFNQRKL